MFMHNNLSLSKMKSRLLRIEGLENREMLSVSPVSPAEVQDSAIFSAAVVDTGDAPVALNLDAEQNAGVSFEETDAQNEYVLSWEPMAGFDAYHVKISRDGGETWITYRKSVDTTSCAANGIYLGNSYMFKVCGFTDSGKPDYSTAVYGTFAPISLTSTTTEFSYGDVLTTTLEGADDASAEVRWYACDPQGDVEIIEARGLLSYKPADASVAIKVVATGTGISTGSNSTYVFNNVQSTAIVYNEDTRSASVSWGEVENAASYRLQISRNNGETWANYGTPTTETFATVNGLYAGRSYMFRIIARTADNKTISTHETTFAPVGVSTKATEYRVGDTITIKLAASDNASAAIRWYKVTSQGDVEIMQNAGRLQYTAKEALYPIKVVVTGTGVSTGSVSEVLVNVGSGLNAGNFKTYYTAGRCVETTWDIVDGANEYRFYKKVDGVWKRTAAITVENGVVTSGNATISADGKTMTYQVNMLNVNANGEFLVVAGRGATAIVSEVINYRPFGVQLVSDTYDPDGATTLTAVVSPEAGDYSAVWYRYNAARDMWTKVGTGTSFVVDDLVSASKFKYSVVVTDTATGNQSVAYAWPDAAAIPGNVLSEYDEARKILYVTFEKPAGAADDVRYQVQYLLDDVPYPTWLNLNGCEFEDNGDGTITAVLAAEKIKGYNFRVCAFGDAAANDRSIWRSEAVEKPAGITIDNCDYDAQRVTVSWDAVADADEYLLSCKLGDVTLDSIVVSSNYHSYTIVNPQIAVQNTLVFSVSAVVGNNASNSVSTYKKGSNAPQDFKLETIQNDSERSCTVSWSPVDNARGYVVVTQTEDKGVTQITLDANTTSYVFQTTRTSSVHAEVRAILPNGKTTDASSGDFIPALATLNKTEYVLGDTLTASLVKSDAQVKYSWYAFQGGHWNQIDGAESASIVVTAELASAKALQVHVTGVGVSAGSYDNVIAENVYEFKAPEWVSLTSTQDGDSRKITVYWKPAPRAENYYLTLTTEVGVATSPLISAPAASYEFALNIPLEDEVYVSVYAVDANGVEAGPTTTKLLPAVVELNNTTYFSGDLLTASLRYADATADYTWYMDRFGFWQEIEGATGNSITVTGDVAKARAIKVVATGTGLSAQTVFSAEATRYEDDVRSPEWVRIRQWSEWSEWRDTQIRRVVVEWAPVDTGEHKLEEYTVRLEWGGATYTYNVNPSTTSFTLPFSFSLDDSVVVGVSASYSDVVEHGSIVGWTNFTEAIMNPTIVSLNVQTYSVGDTLRANLRYSDPDAEYKWYGKNGSQTTLIAGETKSYLYVTDSLGEYAEIVVSVVGSQVRAAGSVSTATAKNDYDGGGGSFALIDDLFCDYFDDEEFVEG